MIIIEKAARTLTYRSEDGKIILRFPVSLGSCPVGPKRSEGDGKTPEGVYRICTINPESKFHLSFGLSYPSPSDAAPARAEGRIGLLDFLKIRMAHALGLRPAWNTPLGGYIMLHGESPDGRTGDWTQGCIALSNADIDKLKKHVKKGERVEITP